MFKGLGYAVCVLLASCHPASNPARQPDAKGEASAPTSASATASALSPEASAAGVTPPAGSASAAPVTPAVAAVEKAARAAAAADAPARTTAQTAREQCANGYPTPECYASFPQKVSCPAQLADVPRGEYCGIEGHTAAAACPYSTALCTCKHIPYCGGVAPTPLQQMGMTWQCVPPRKAGDCPEAAARGGHCSVAGQQCSYGGCGSSTECTCNAGKYRCQDRIQPTPP